jgi:hypothetical protein
LTFVIIGHERGIPSKCGSSAHADYVPALCTHRPSLLPIGWLSEIFGLLGDCSNVNARREIDQTWSSRGSKSRNKVSVGEPAEGSLVILGSLLVVKDWLAALVDL